MNQHEHLIKRLQAAKTAIDHLLNDLVGDASRGEPLKTCPICGETIYAGDPMQRGIHKKCVGIGLSRVKSGSLTREQLEAMLEPPAKAGRKPKPLAIDAQRSIAESAAAKVDKTVKRLDATKQRRKKSAD